MIHFPSLELFKIFTIYFVAFSELHLEKNLTEGNKHSIIQNK